MSPSKRSSGRFKPHLTLSSFSVDDLKTLLKTAKIKPVVNQSTSSPPVLPTQSFLTHTHAVLLHPYVIHQQTPLLEYMHEQDIKPEGYSSLIPLTSKQGGPVDKPVADIGIRIKAEPEQVLLAWSRAKG